MKNGGGFVDPYEAKLAAAKEKEPKEPSFASPALKKVTPGAKAEPGSSSDKTFEMPKLRSTPGSKAPESNANGGSPIGGNASPVPTSAPSATPGVPSKASGVATVDKPAGTVTFSKAELAAMDATSGIDMERKESYLSAGEFVEVFGMERSVFDAMPLWKRQAAKKKAGLF